jgi:hypothetical protein
LNGTRAGKSRCCANLDSDDGLNYEEALLRTMTELQLAKLIEEAERRTGVKPDTSYISESRHGVVIDLYNIDCGFVIHEALSTPHPKTAEQREDFIGRVCEGLELLSSRANSAVLS